MEYTTNYKLKKPGDEDNVLVSDLNENMDKVDEELKKRANLDPDTGKVPEGELPDDLFLKLIGGTMKGHIQMANFLVKGLPDPQEDGDAARKGYVDKTFSKVAYGSYVGTGTKGIDNKNSLTFPFPPKYLIISGSTASGKRGINGLGFGDPSQQITVSANTVSTYTTTANNPSELVGNTVSWYCEEGSAFESGEGHQLNSSGVKYYYVAFG